MSSGNVTRRFVMGALGAGAAAAAVKVAGAAPIGVAGASGPVSEHSAPGGPDAVLPQPASHALVAPLGPGSALARWTVQNVLPVEGGALALVLADAEGRSFQLDVCARDRAEAAVAPPGRSEHFDVFLANRGDGTTVTHEEHGLAAMALADVIRHNEHAVEHSGFTTLAERLQRAPEQVRVIVRG